MDNFIDFQRATGSSDPPRILTKPNAPKHNGGWELILELCSHHNVLDGLNVRAVSLACSAHKGVVGGSAGFKLGTREGGSYKVFGRTPLQAACSIRGNLERVKQLIFDRGQRDNLNVCDSEGMFPLAQAAGCGDLQMVEFILSEGGGNDPRSFFQDEHFSKVVSFENHPVRRAINNPARYAPEVVKVLLMHMEKKFGPKSVDDMFKMFSRRGNPLHYVLEKFTDSKNSNATAMCRVLVQHRPALVQFENNIVPPEQFSPLHQVARYRQHLPILKELLKLRADPNVANQGNGLTPLHFAAHRLNYNACAELLAAKANANAISTDGLGCTPLHMLIAPWRYASCTRDFKQGLHTYEVFLCFGADIHQEDTDGRRPSFKLESLASLCGFGRERKFFSSKNPIIGERHLEGIVDQRRRRSIIEHSAADGTTHRYLVNEEFRNKLAEVLYSNFYSNSLLRQSLIGET